MKKKTVVILCAVLAVLIAGGGVGYSFLPHPLNYPIGKIEPAEKAPLNLISETEDSVTLQKGDAAPLRILYLTDMHLDGKNATSKDTVGNMLKAIEKEQPDLVLLCGDNVTSGMNRARCRQLGKIFEQLGVYWGGTLGNHEGDNQWSITRDEMMGIFASFDHCIMRKGPADIDGNGNYVINLLNAEGKHMQSVFCLDTFDEVSDEQRAQYGMTEEDSEYDGAHENQVAWYAQKAQALKADYGDNYKSVMLVHIPLAEYAAAVDGGAEFLYGVKMEGICCTGYDNGLFRAIKDAGVTQAVYCGHDHNNSFGVEYDGVILSYLETSGYGSYGLHKQGYPEEEWLQGYSVMDILDDGTYSFREETYYNMNR